MNAPTVTLITPSLPGRERMLAETVRSVEAQTVPCKHLWLADVDRLGPAPIRNKLLAQVDTELVGFVDDDDVLDPQHVELCRVALQESGACVAYPWFRFNHPRGWWPLGEFLQIQRPDGTRVHAFGQPFAPDGLEHNSFIPVTVIARTECLRKVDGFPTPESPEWPHDTAEEWGLWRRLVADGHTFVHLPAVTWEYRVHGGNTSGRRTA